MRSVQIVAGHFYVAKVGKVELPVEILSKADGLGNWNVRNLRTQETIKINARRLIEHIVPMWAPHNA